MQKYTNTIKKFLNTLSSENCTTKDFFEKDDSFLEWTKQFLKSPSFEQLTEEQKKYTDFTFRCFAELLADMGVENPWGLSKDNISELCLEVFPRKITVELPFFKCVGPVLIAFFDYLAINALFWRAQDISNCIKTIQAEIPKRAKDSKNWGISKFFAMKALEEGIDLTDPAQCEKFMKKCNQHLKG